MGVDAKLLIPSKTTNVQDVIFATLKLCKSDQLHKKFYKNNKNEEVFYFSYSPEIINTDVTKSNLGKGFLKFIFYENDILDNPIHKNLYFDLNYIYNNESYILLSSKANQLNSVLFHKLNQLFGGYILFSDSGDDYFYKKPEKMIYRGEQNDSNENYAKRKNFIDNLKPISYIDFFNKRFPKNYSYSYEDSELLDKLKEIYNKELIIKEKNNITKVLEETNNNKKIPNLNIKNIKI